METHTPAVSVIIPVYNAEKYIERCLRSLLSQTLKDIELIIIDDSCTDNSMAIVRRLLAEDTSGIKARLLQTKQNSNRAHTRTCGMKEASGKYMIHCDPDDWTDHEMYRVMYEQAEATDSDIVVCRHCKEYADGTSIIEGPLPDGNGRRMLKESRLCHALWNKMIRTSLIREHNIYPFEGIDYDEDGNIVIRAAFFAQKITSVPGAYYHYNQSNPNSITKHSASWFLDNYGYRNIRMLEQFFKENDPGGEMSLVLARVKYEYKAPLLRTAHKDGAKWCRIFPEVHRDIRRMNLPFMFRHILWLIADCPALVKLFARYLCRKD